MADQAREWTDEELARLEAHIRQVYAQSEQELTAKWNAYMATGQRRLSDLYANYVSAPADKKADALKRYQDAAQNYTLRNEWYRQMVSDTTYRIAHVNEIAIDYINGKMPEIYAVNYNQIDEVAFAFKPDWTLVDEHTVRNLLMDSLPSKTVNYAKDMRWNTKQINSAVLQGILQGESMSKIAERLLPIVNNNQAAAIRTARTMVTGAENRGRYDRSRAYTEAGLVNRRVWLATPDHRVRDWHLSMDGQEEDEYGYFIDGLGEELAYPGDPDGSPRTTYNCRCSTEIRLIGVRGRDGEVHEFGSFDDIDLHDEQIFAEKERRGFDDEEEW